MPTEHNYAYIIFEKSPTSLSHIHVNETFTEDCKVTTRMDKLWQ